MAERDPELQMLLDKQAITEQLLRYCRAVDRKDIKLLESVYWPGATDDHVRYCGDVSGFIEFFRTAHSDLRITQHVLANILIEFESETRARCESYIHAYHEAPPKSGKREEFIVGGRFIDLFEKRGREWRIAYRKLCVDYCSSENLSDATAFGRYKDLEMAGGRFPDDPLYRVFAPSR